MDRPFFYGNTVLQDVYSLDETLELEKEQGKCFDLFYNIQVYFIICSSYFLYKEQMMSPVSKVFLKNMNNWTKGEPASDSWTVPM